MWSNANVCSKIIFRGFFNERWSLNIFSRSWRTYWGYCWRCLWNSRIIASCFCLLTLEVSKSKKTINFFVQLYNFNISQLYFWTCLFHKSNVIFLDAIRRIAIHLTTTKSIIVTIMTQPPNFQDGITTLLGMTESMLYRYIYFLSTHQSYIWIRYGYWNENIFI